MRNTLRRWYNESKYLFSSIVDSFLFTLYSNKVNKHIYQPVSITWSTCVCRKFSSEKRFSSVNNNEMKCFVSWKSAIYGTGFEILRYCTWFLIWKIPNTKSKWWYLRHRHETSEIILGLLEWNPVFQQTKPKYTLFYHADKIWASLA